MTEHGASLEAVAFRDLLASRWIGYAIHAAAALDLVDALTGAPRSAASVAGTVGADPVALDRLMRALVTIGLLRNADDRYDVTPLGALLRSDARESFRGQVLLTGGERSLRGWAEFVECVRTGYTSAQILDGINDTFAWFAERPEEQARFDAAMAEGTTQMADAIAAAYDFSDIGTVVDVGGGYGALLPPILQGYPKMTALVFDRPHCRAGATQLTAEAHVSDRCQFVGGDFFEDPLPPDADAYILKSVIHDWDDERSVALLRRCRHAMLDRSLLLVIEVVLPDRLGETPEHRRMVWADLNMLVATGGRERTRSQYDALFATADLRISSIAPTRTPTAMSVIEVRRA